MTNTNTEWEKELRERVNKSFGFIATEGKQALMIAEFERQRDFVRTEKAKSFQEGVAAERERHERDLEVAVAGLNQLRDGIAGMRQEIKHARQTISPTNTV